MVDSMRLLLMSAVALAILAGPARAQMDPLQLKYEGERRERLENEKKYDEMMRHTQRGTTETKAADPWRTVRPTETNNKGKDRQPPN
jgi:hypothetical protein